MAMFSTRQSSPTGGNTHAGGGAFTNVPMRIVDTQEWMVYENDFLTFNDYDASGDATADFQLIQIAGGAASIVVDNTGLLRCTTDAQNRGPIIQFGIPNASPRLGILPAAASATAHPTEAVMSCRFKLNRAGANGPDLFIGFAEANAGSAVIGATGVLTSDTHAGFHSLESAATTTGAVHATIAGSDDTQAVESATLFNATDDVYHEVAVRILGVNNARFYHRNRGTRHGRPSSWAHVATLTGLTNWDARMYPTFAFIGDNAGDVLDIDRFTFAVRRDLTIVTT